MDGKSCFFAAALLIASLLVPNALSKEFQVGVSPLILDAGDLQRGDSKLASFSLLTNSVDEFMIGLSASPVDMDFIEKRHETLMQYSEEPAYTWAEFMNNPVTISSYYEGPNIKRWENINFLINIPPDAEPGYHAFVIEPMPLASSEAGGTGMGVVAATKVTVMLKVPGEVTRSGNILDITANRVGNRVRINVFFHNNGTVSMSNRAENISIYYKNGTLLREIKSNSGFAGPDQTMGLTGFLGKEEMPPGEYEVFANVSYLSGHATRKAPVIVPAKEEAITGQGVVAGPAYMPLWVLVVPIILAFSYAVYTYRRE